MNTKRRDAEGSQRLAKPLRLGVELHTLMNDGTPWITLTSDDLNACSTGARIAAMLTGQRPAGYTNAFTNVMQDVTMKVRIAIATSNKPVSAASFSIPPEARADVLWLIIEQLSAGMEGFEFTQADRERIEAAHQYLEGLKSDREAFSAPPPVEAVMLDIHRAGVVLSTELRDRVFTRHAMRNY